MIDNDQTAAQFNFLIDILLSSEPKVGKIFAVAFCVFFCKA
jgi:hypothetical protein